MNPPDLFHSGEGEEVRPKDNDEDWSRNFEFTGDKTFKKNEEEFWHTNPDDPNTAGNGNVDEANVVGLGQNKFTWTYQASDQVGSAVRRAGSLYNSTGPATSRIWPIVTAPGR